jgi:hypothetical protein
MLARDLSLYKVIQEGFLHNIYLPRDKIKLSYNDTSTG